jgi:uridine phosphorylase
MPLWGTRDSFSITGTVAFVEDSTAVVGTSTAFTTELDLGDVIINSAGAKYKVVAITDDENLTIAPAYATANASGQTITGQDAPKFLAAEGATIQAVDKIFGVDSTEAVAQTTDPG